MKPAPNPSAETPFTEKLKDRLAELLDAIAERLFPTGDPEPVPIPVRVRDRRGR